MSTIDRAVERITFSPDLAEDSKTAFLGTLARYRSWAADHGEEADLSAETVLAYTRSIRGRSGGEPTPNTKKATIKRLQAVARAAGLDVTYGEDPDIRRFLSRASKTHDRPVRHSPPIGLPRLRKVLAVMDRARPNPKSARTLALFSMAFSTMARRNSLLALTIGSVTWDGDRATITFGQEKTMAGRRVPLGATASLYLHNHLALMERAGVTGDERPLFPSVTRHGSYRARALSPRAFNELVVEHVGEGYSPHGFRAGGAQHMDDLRRPIREILARGGWRSRATLLRYLAIEDHDLVADVDPLDLEAE